MKEELKHFIITVPSFFYFDVKARNEKEALEKVHIKDTYEQEIKWDKANIITII